MKVTKTYALLDLVGVKEKLEDGGADELLRAFWNVCEDWTNHTCSHIGQVEAEDGAGMTPKPRVVTYSDSALLKHDPLLTLHSFYALVKDLKDKIESKAGKCAAIVIRGDEIEPDAPTMHVGYGGDPTPAYLNVFGSGPVVVDLYLADQGIRAATAWHGLYTLYCVGDESKIAVEKDKRMFKGMTRPVYALA